MADPKPWELDYEEQKPWELEYEAPSGRGIVPPWLTPEKQTINSLAPVLPSPEPKPSVGTIGPIIQPSPQEIATSQILHKPIVQRQPIEEPLGEYRRAHPQTPWEVLQMETKIPVPKMSEETGTKIAHALNKIRAVPSTPEQDIATGRLIAGSEQALGSLVDFMTAPGGIGVTLTGGIMAPEVAGARLSALAERSIATAFAVDMAKNLPEQTATIMDAIERGDTTTATRELLNATAALGVIKHAAKGTVSPLPGKPSLATQRVESIVGEQFPSLLEKGTTPGDVVRESLLRQPLQPAGTGETSSEISRVQPQTEGRVQEETAVTPTVVDEPTGPGESARFTTKLPEGYASGFVKEGVAELQAIEVNKSERRKGVGERLLRQFTEKAKQSGATSIAGDFSPSAKAMMDKVFGKPESEAPTPDWPEGSGPAPTRATYNIVADPHAVAGEIGFEHRPAKQIGAFQIPDDLSSYSPEDRAKFEALKKAYPEQWEFTDTRKGSSTKGLTFYTKKGATRQEILKAHQNKLDEIKTAEAKPAAELGPEAKALAEEKRRLQWNKSTHDRRTAISEEFYQKEGFKELTDYREEAVDDALTDPKLMDMVERLPQVRGRGPKDSLINTLGLDRNLIPQPDKDVIDYVKRNHPDLWETHQRIQEIMLKGQNTKGFAIAKLMESGRDAREAKAILNDWKNSIYDLRKEDPGLAQWIDYNVFKGTGNESQLSAGEPNIYQPPAPEPTEPELVGSIESRGALGGNISAFGLFDPANYGPAVRAAAKATKESIDAATRKVQVTRKAFGNIARSFSTRHVIDQTLDAADNMANIIGQQQGKNVKLGIKPEQDEAASVLVAAGFDKARAQDFLAKAQKGKNKKVEAIVDYALKNWNQVEPVARRGQSAFENQLRQENAAGIDTERHEDYLPGVYDMDLMMGVNRPFVIGGQRISGVGTGFKKGKTFASPFDAVESGYSPRSLKLSDLVENRIRSGQRLINRRAWGESLKSIVDPTDNRPIAENLIVKRRPNGTSYEVAPPGYVTRELLPGVRMGIHESYQRLFDALTGNSSAVREFEVGGIPVGQATLQAVGGVKHGMLLLDTFHAMRVMKKELFVAGKVGYKKGLSLLEYSPSDLARAVKEGDITQDMADYATANRPTADLLIKNGLNVGRVQQAMYTALVRKIPVIGGFNKWVFEKLTRGAMMEAGIHEFNRVKNNNPHLTDTEVARQVSRDLNKYFGNLQRQGVFKSQTMLDISGLAGFAPQWIESQVRSELGGAKQLVVDPILKRQLSVGTLGSSMARGLAAYVVATQLINLATRRQFTWQNEEKDHKLDAWIPDVTGKTGGYWMSPLSGAAENTKDVMDAISDEPDVLAAAGRIMANKSGSLVRAGKILLQGRDWRDQKIIGSWNKMKQAGIQLAPVPIPASTAVKGGPPGSTQRQIMQSLGEKVTPVKTANQEIGKMARKWGLASDDPKIKFQFQQEAQMQYGESAFKPVRDALREGDSKKIVDAVQAVLDREPTEEAAGKRLTAMLNDFSPFTKQGIVKPIAAKSKENEQKFLESLDDRGKQVWINALKERVNAYRTLTKAIYGAPRNPPIPEEYRDLFK